MEKSAIVYFLRNARKNLPKNQNSQKRNCETVKL